MKHKTSKKKNLIITLIRGAIFSIALFYFFAFFVSAEKIIPGDTSQALGPEHVADKIVAHGYTLIDAYVKELAGPGIAFPGGVFSFDLHTDIKIRVEFSPAGIGGKVWRTMGFHELCSDECWSHIIVLDGPISGEPGTPNEEVITGAKQELTGYLADANMGATAIKRENGTTTARDFDLSSQYDFQDFIDLMHDSIELSSPLEAEEEAQVTLPPGTLINVNPTAKAKEAIEVNGTSFSFEILKTMVSFKNQEKEIKISIDSQKQESNIQIENTMVIIKQPIEIKESKLYLQTSGGLEEVDVLPQEALNSSAAVVKMTRIENIELKEESQKPIYSVRATRKARLLFFIPVTLNIETKIDAESGEVISVKKPWWSFLAW